MKIRYLAALLVLASAASPAIADSCTSTTNLGTIGVPSITGVWNSFSGPTSFVDCYNFTLGGSGTVSDIVFEIDPWLNKLDINLSSIVLSSSSLVISGVVSRDAGLFNTSVGYVGLLIATGTTGGNSVPEPGTLALFGLGLLGVGFASRRRANR